MDNLNAIRLRVIHTLAEAFEELGTPKPIALDRANEVFSELSVDDIIACASE